MAGEIQVMFVTPTLGLVPVGSSSAEFRAFVANAIKRFAEAARVAGVEPE